MGGTILWLIGLPITWIVGPRYVLIIIRYASPFLLLGIAVGWQV